MKKAVYRDKGEATRTLNPDDSLPRRWSRGFLAAKAALLAAPKSDFNGRPPGKQVGAAIFDGNRLISSGNNTMLKTIPLPENQIEGSDAHRTLHAEQSAVMGIRHKEYTSLTCYVVRLNVAGDYVTSKPCQMCRITLRDHGVKRVRYVNTLGLFEEMRLDGSS